MTGHLWIFVLSNVLSPLIVVGLVLSRIFWSDDRFLSKVFGVIAAFVWGFAHNPSLPTQTIESAQVVWAGGCGVMGDDLIIKVGYSLFRANGQALSGDIVRVTPTNRKFGGTRLQVVQRNGRRSTICSVGLLVKNQLDRRSEAFPGEVAGWLQAFVVGDQKNLAPTLRKSFQDLGLLHLLVLSGGHITVLGVLLNALIRAPWLFRYLMARLAIDSWIRVCSVSNVLTAILLCVYCAAAGFSQSLQRAYLSFFIVHILPMIGIEQTMKRRILAVLIVQAAIFPVNFLSLSMMMSWGGVLILSAFMESSYLKPLWQTLALAFQIQVIFFAASLIFFGKAGILSIPCNLIFQMVFSILLPIDIFAMFLPTNALDVHVVSLNRFVLEGISSLAKFQGYLPVQEITISRNYTLAAPMGRGLAMTTLVALFMFAGLRRTKNF